MRVRVYSSGRERRIWWETAMPHQDAPTTTIVLEVDGAGTMVECGWES